MLSVTLGLWVAAFYCARLATESAGTSDRLFSAGATLFLVALGLLIGRGLTIIRPNDAIILLFSAPITERFEPPGFDGAIP